MNEVIIKMTKCIDCNDLDHTGAFTKNGSLGCCRNSDAPKNFCMKDHTKKQRDKNYFIAKIENANKIPDWCPLLKS